MKKMIGLLMIGCVCVFACGSGTDSSCNQIQRSVDGDECFLQTHCASGEYAALQKEFPNHTINGSILCPTRLESSDDIEGLNDYLVLLGYDRITVKEFDKIGEMMGKKVREALAN